MIKKKILGIFILSTILLLPFSSTIYVAGAPAPSYLGVTEGQEIIWEINLDKNNIETAVTDVTDALNEVYDYLGNESNGLEDFIEQWIPDEYLDMNITSAICELLYNITNTINSSIIPDLWVDKNITTIVSDIANYTANYLFPGVLPEDFMESINMTELITTLFNNVTGTVIPDASDLSLPDFIDFILDNYIPVGLFENGWRDILNVTTLIDELLTNITAQLDITSWLDFNVSTFIINTLDNLTTDLMPAGWLNMNASALSDALIDASLVTQTMVDTLNITQLICIVIENLTSDIMPAGWTDLTMTNLFSTLIGDFEGINPIVDAMISNLYPMVLQSYLMFISAMTSTPFLDYSYQDLLDYALYQSTSMNYPYWTAGNIIDSITGDYSFTMDHYYKPSYYDSMSGTVTFNSPYIVFPVLDISFDTPSPGYCEITLDGSVSTSTLTELGYSSASEADFRITYVTETPYISLTVGELIDMGLSGLGMIQIPPGPQLSTVSNLNITAPISGNTFLVGADPSWNTWTGGVVMIDKGFGQMGIFPVESVFNGGTYEEVTIEAQAETLEEMGYGVNNATIFYETGYSQLNFSSMNMEEIIDIIFAMISSPLVNFSTPFPETIEDALILLNSTLFSMGLAPNFLNLTINEAIDICLNALDMGFFFVTHIQMGSSMLIDTIYNDYSFTVIPDPANATWNGQTAHINGMRLPILSVTDNVTNVIIETPVNLTAMGVSPGFNMVTIYEQVFDLFNDSLDDLLNMIPYFSLSASGLLDMATGSVSALTIREYIQMGMEMLNQSIISAHIPIGGMPPSQVNYYETAEILEVTGDWSLKIPHDMDVFDCINGGVSISGRLYVIESLTPIDGGNNISITIVPGMGMPLSYFLPSIPPAIVDVYFCEKFFDVDFAGDTLHEIIHGCIEFVNESYKPSINFLNTFMDDDVEGYPYFMNMLEYSGYFTNTLALKLVIDSIGDEIDTPGGIKGVPLYVSLYFSPDMVNWMEISLSTIGLSNFFILESYGMLGGVSPSMVSIEQGPMMFLSAIQMFIPMTFGLLLPNTVDWSILNHEVTITSTGIILPGMNLLTDLKDIYLKTGWTTAGILDSIEVQYDGNLVVSINLQEAVQEPAAVPGFAIVMILGITASTSIGLIYVVMKKKRTL